MRSVPLALPAHLHRCHVAAGAAGCAALAVVAIFDPSRHALGPPCPLRAVTGLDCPLCGATRATHRLLRGDVAGALDFNALYVAMLPLAAVLGALWLVSGRRPGWLGTRRTVWVASAVAGAFAVLRNLPLALLTPLAS